MNKEKTKQKRATVRPLISARCPIPGCDFFGIAISSSALSYGLLEHVIRHIPTKKSKSFLEYFLGKFKLEKVRGRVGAS